MITRFPPSPTGDLHIGGVRTALYSWLMTQKNKGKFILRIEDTDTKREKENAVAGIIEGLNWLGLSYDEGPIFQTDRFDRYKEVINQLLVEDKAYYCYCSKEKLEEVRNQQMKDKQKPKYNGCCRNKSNAKAEAEQNGIKPVVRFKNPLDGIVSWSDLVHGEIKISNAELDDLIIERSDGTPTYNLCVVVDDVDMKMTHIIRGDDHINNTPRQINIFEALGQEIPFYGHVGMILGDDGKRLSKRHGAAGVLEYREAGYLPKAVLNYLVRLGWSYKDKEIFSIDEMIDLFDIKDVNKAASTFNTEKLNWLNQQYIKETPADKLVDDLKYQFDKLNINIANFDLTKVIVHYAERAKTLKEMAEQTSWLFEEVTEYPAKQAKKAFHNEAKIYLEAVLGKLEKLESLTWKQEELHTVITSTVEEFEVGFGKVGMPVRLALTGGKPSPGLDDIMLLLGKDKTIKALTNAISFLN